MIYFIQSTSGPIKIGQSVRKIRKRLKEMQTSCPHKLLLLGTMKGGRELEKRIHNAFQDYRCNGGSEWFTPEKPVLNFIQRFAKRDPTHF